MADKDKKVTGGIGTPPPPDAPRETAQPLKPEFLERAARNAAQNEQTLPPFNPPKGMTPPPTFQIQGHVVENNVAALSADFFGSDAPNPQIPVAAAPVSAPEPRLTNNPVSAEAASPLPPLFDPAQGSVDQLEDHFPELSEEDRRRMPAASNTEDPSRGRLPNLVPPSGDKFEGIDRGGFGHSVEAGYFPLTGEELRELILAQLDTVAAQLRNDLRFSIALTYPRVRARVSIEVEGHPEDSDVGFTIERIISRKAGEKGGTALELARGLADQVCFVVMCERSEINPDGSGALPPDAIRDELGIERPGKRIVSSTHGMRFADIVVGRS